MCSIMNRISSHLIRYVGLRSNRSLRIISARNLVHDLDDNKLSYEFGGVPSESIGYSPLTIGNLLERAVKTHPNQIAFIVSHQKIEKTFQQFEYDVRQQL